MFVCPVKVLISNVCISSKSSDIQCLYIKFKYSVYPAKVSNSESVYPAKVPKSMFLYPVKFWCKSFNVQPRKKFDMMIATRTCLLIHPAAVGLPEIINLNIKIINDREISQMEKGNMS